MTYTSPTLVIAGSLRPTRISPKIAAWIAALGEEATHALFETLDLADWPLPMDDEPGMPQSGHYTQDHTRAWSAKIAAAPGFVFVMPQYNGGYPAPLKNAIDHLYREWAGKPALIVTYGGHGGGRGGEQLAQVCSFVKMKPLETRPALTLPRERIEANDGQIDPAVAFASQRDEIGTALAEYAAVLATDDAAVISR
ncbi:NADPH-dependent FMN reductase [Sphingomonas glacialis]|uniref:NAD(P)H-dependent oxidoreductase n=1 Tax=Sphingomonas glacialis TaxID=658225 RepID=A0A502FZT2_9SPHN|nr:NAD(P)H-dependent oxidoreductase [Sphingomonas glacialis]TPG54881.1 NAD(P)H-dependent oxidoreductase [Sphingomonas glacialis]